MGPEGRRKACFLNIAAEDSSAAGHLFRRRGVVLRAREQVLDTQTVRLSLTQHKLHAQIKVDLPQAASVDRNNAYEPLLYHFEA